MVSKIEEKYSKIKKKIINLILKNEKSTIINNITYIDLCEYCYKIYDHILKENKTNILIFDIETLSSENKIILLITSMLFNLDIYTYISNDIINNEILDNEIINKIVFNKEKIDKTISISDANLDSKIYYKNNNNYFITNWNKIFEFINSSIDIIFIYIVKNRINFIFIPEIVLNNIYILYFIPLVLLKNILLITDENLFLNLRINEDNKYLILSDDTKLLEKKNYGILILTKYSYNSSNNLKNNNYLSLFFSLNVNQYLIYNIQESKDKIIGRLLSIYKLINFNDGYYLLYNKNKIKLPITYYGLKENILLIKKKFSKLIFSRKPKDNKNLNLKMNIIDKYFVKNNFTKLIFLNSKYNLCENSGYILYKYLLESFNYLNIKNYNDINLCNKFLFNGIDIISNSLFSLYIYNNRIIIHISYIIEGYENIIIENIDNIIIKILNIENIKIENDEKINKKMNENINIINEIKYLFKVGIYIMPIFIYNIFNFKSVDNEDDNQDRKQINYYFDRDEMIVLIKKSNSLTVNYLDLFRFYLLKSLNKFLNNYLVILDNNKIFPLFLYDNLDINLHINLCNLLDNSILVQKYIIYFIFSYLYYRNLNKKFNFIQISEKIIDNSLNNINILKSNIKCEIDTFPIQINYIVYNQEILITIAGIKKIDILENVIEDIQKYLK